MIAPTSFGDWAFFAGTLGMLGGLAAVAHRVVEGESGAGAAVREPISYPIRKAVADDISVYSEEPAA